MAAIMTNCLRKLIMIVISNSLDQIEYKFIEAIVLTFWNTSDKIFKLNVQERPLYYLFYTF